MQRSFASERQKRIALESTCAELQAEVRSRKPIVECKSRSTNTPGEWNLPRVEFSATGFDTAADTSQAGTGKGGSRTKGDQAHPPPKMCILHYITNRKLQTVKKYKDDRVIAIRAMMRVTMQLIMEKIYADEVDDRERTNRCDMSEFAYNYFLHKYGLCALADIKVHNVCVSLEQYRRRPVESLQGSSLRSIFRITFLHTLLGLIGAPGSLEFKGKKKGKKRGKKKVKAKKGKAAASQRHDHDHDWAMEFRPAVKMEVLNFFLDAIKAAHDRFGGKGNWVADESSGSVSLSLSCALKVSEYMFPSSAPPPPLFPGGPPGKRKPASPFCLVLTGEGVVSCRDVSCLVVPCLVMV